MAQEKVDVFVTHCGGNSVVEANYFQTKVLGMPIIEEQRGVAYRAETMGIGKRIKTVNSDKQVLSIVREVLFNSP